MKLIIAEKPSLARNITSAIGNSKFTKKTVILKALTISLLSASVICLVCWIYGNTA